MYYVSICLFVCQVEFDTKPELPDIQLLLRLPHRVIFIRLYQCTLHRKCFDEHTRTAL